MAMEIQNQILAEKKRDNPAVLNSELELLFSKPTNFVTMVGCSDLVKPRVQPYKFSNQKLKDLGLEFTSVEQSLYDIVKSLQDKGHLPIPSQPKEGLRIQ